MRAAFAHTAVLDMLTADDERAPGAAITETLCGAYDHQPPCPLAAHHTAATRDGNQIHLRVLFAADPADAARVRSGIDTTLANGQWRTPDGDIIRWQLLTSGPTEIATADAAHAERLRHDPPR